MTVTINGTLRSFDREMSVLEVLGLLEISSEGVAVALDGSVIPRKQHPHTSVHDGAVVEIIRAAAGG